MSHLVNLTPVTRTLLLLGMIGMGCGNGDLPTASDDPNDFAITLVLQTFNTRQKAIVSEVVSTGEDPIVYINDANLAVQGIPFQAMRRDSVPPEYTLEKAYNYYTDSLQVEPGKSYTMTIKMPNETVVSGTTTIPEDVFLVEMTETSEDFVFRWQGMARMYEWIFSHWRTDEQIWWEISSRVVYENEARIRKQSVNRDVGRFRLTLRSFDDNYYAFLREQKSRAGLQGGFGMMGSVHQNEWEIHF